MSSVFDPEDDSRLNRGERSPARRGTRERIPKQPKKELTDKRAASSFLALFSRYSFLAKLGIEDEAAAILQRVLPVVNALSPSGVPDLAPVGENPEQIGLLERIAEAAELQAQQSQERQINRDAQTE